MVFCDPASRYELAEVMRLTRCSRDDIQNWVRRGMLEPDETTPGRNIFVAKTVASLLISARLRRRGIAANYALLHGMAITKIALNWIHGRELAPGEMPTFERDFRARWAVYYICDAPSPQAPGTLPGILFAHIVKLDELDDFLPDQVDALFIRLHWLWLGLAERARALKARPSRRLLPEGT